MDILKILKPRKTMYKSCEPRWSREAVLTGNQHEVINVPKLTRTAAGVAGEGWGKIM